MVRVTDYIANYIYKLGINHIFMVTGGGAMFLNDGIAKHPYLKAICHHHEQAASMAAVGYAKYKNDLSAVLVTTGCGGTNAITGLLDAWQDNLPVLFISGQVKRKETICNSSLPLRQLGVQEADIVSIVKSLTKYAVTINDPNKISYHLDKAVYLAKHGRHGPVWLDIPLDVQGALIDESSLIKFNPQELNFDYKTEPSEEEIKTFTQYLSEAKRPCVIAGNGIKLSHSVDIFRKFIEMYNLPVAETYLGIGVLPSEHPLNIGRTGIKGDRAGNFVIQNSDLVIAIGTRLSVGTTGFEYDYFAREAKVIVIDIDPIEHKKNTIKIDYFINADVKKFLDKVLKIYTPNLSAEKKWTDKCFYWKNKWPVCLPEYKYEKEGINLYYFLDRLSKKMKDDSVVVSDAGSAYYATSQGIKIRANQKYLTSGAQAEMGFTLPASIGVSVARNFKEVIGITGDGSFQFNIQELQTIVYHKFPIKIFIWNNSGYLSIRATQSKFFNKRFIGTDPNSGVSFPNFKKIAYAYGIKYFKVSSAKKLDKIIEKTLNYPTAVICEVITPKNQLIIPTASSKKLPDGRMISKPLEDMFPFLDRKEFYKEMIVKPIDEEE